MSLFRYVGLCSLLIIVGCSGAMGNGYVKQSERQAYVDRHPDLPPRIHKAILQGTPAVGMTQDQLVAAVGTPRDATTTTTRYGTRQQLVYRDALGTVYWRLPRRRPR